MTELGVGLAFRVDHDRCLPRLAGAVDFFELMPDPSLLAHGPSLAAIDRLAASHPVIVHAIELSLGSIDPGPEHAAEVQRTAGFCARVGARLLSDHLSFVAERSVEAGSFVPLFGDDRGVEVVARNCAALRRVLGADLPLALENVSYHVRWPGPAYGEAEMIGRVCRAAGCGLLLDVNNLFVNAANHHYDPYRFLAEIPRDQVAYVHVAGHRRAGGVLFDTHDTLVAPEVWELAEHALRTTSAAGIVLERDDPAATEHELLAECGRLRELWRKTRRRASGRAPSGRDELTA
jgi:uncharacterized protein (UPF0276 family)